MALTPEQQAQLEELNRLANEPEDDEDFEIEIYSSDGSGARLPYRKGKSWVQKTFGIDLGDLPKTPEPKTLVKSDKKTADPASGQETGERALKLFSQRRQTKAS